MTTATELRNAADRAKQAMDRETDPMHREYHAERISFFTEQAERIEKGA